MPLTPDAAAEIAAAIKIVKDDRVYKYIAKASAPATPPPTPPTNAPPAPPVPPPAPKPTDVPPTTPPVKQSAYWGELLS